MIFGEKNYRPCYQKRREHYLKLLALLLSKYKRKVSSYEAWMN
jgi:hypothetical protein